MRVGGLDPSRGVEDDEAAQVVVDRDPNLGNGFAESPQFEGDGEGGGSGLEESPQSVHVDQIP